MLFRMDPPACRLTAYKAYLAVWDKMIKHSHGITAPAYAGQHCRREFSLYLQDLPFGLPADHTLEIPHHGGEWMGPHDRTKDIVCVRHPLCPFPHCFIYSIFKCLRPTCHWMYLCPQQLHPVNIQRLAPGVLPSHKYFTFHPQQCSRRGSGYPVLAGTSFCYDPCFSHFFCQQHLAQYIIDFMGACMVQIFTFEIDFRPYKLAGHFLGIIQ